MKYIFVIVIGIVLGVTGLMIWNKNFVPVPKFDETPYRDSIQVLQTKINESDSLNKIIKHQNDSLVLLKSKVDNHYYERIKYITGASCNELDQFIRSKF